MGDPKARRSLWRRPFDLVLFGAACAFAYTSWTLDALLALGIPLSGDSENAMARMFFTLYAAEADPLLVENPLFLRIQAAISAFVFGPFYVILAYALGRSKNWIRVPALMFASAALYCIVVVLSVNLFGGFSRRDWLLFYVGNLPYLAFPIALAYRMRRPRPFGAPVGDEEQRPGNQQSARVTVRQDRPSSLV